MRHIDKHRDIEERERVREGPRLRCSRLETVTNGEGNRIKEHERGGLGECFWVREI
jgi:hypothetical protein